MPRESATHHILRLAERHCVAADTSRSSDPFPASDDDRSSTSAQARTPQEDPEQIHAHTAVLEGIKCAVKSAGMGESANPVEFWSPSARIAHQCVGCLHRRAEMGMQGSSTKRNMTPNSEMRQTRRDGECPSPGTGGGGRRIAGATVAKAPQPMARGKRSVCRRTDARTDRAHKLRLDAGGVASSSIRAEKPPVRTNFCCVTAPRQDVANQARGSAIFPRPLPRPSSTPKSTSEQPDMVTHTHTHNARTTVRLRVACRWLVLAQTHDKFDSL